jgi:hypothetical protein
MTKSTLAAATLVLCTFSGAAIPAEGLPSRAVVALGQAIAAQGNIALAQIRRELRQSGLKTIEPFLPSAGTDPDEPAGEAADKAAKSAGKPAGKFSDKSARKSTDKSSDASPDPSTDADEPAETPVALRWL